jgi:hypothetical protein
MLRTLKATKDKSKSLEGLYSSLTSTISSIYHSSKPILNPGLETSLCLVLKVGIKHNPFSYMTIMISPLLAKLYGIILEKKNIGWLESYGKRDKGQVEFKSHHSTMDHLVTLMTIAHECHNNKINLLCCPVDFRKYFDIVPRTNL